MSRDLKNNLYVLNIFGNIFNKNESFDFFNIIKYNKNVLFSFA
jgi:hypothetical protein